MLSFNSGWIKICEMFSIQTIMMDLYELVVKCIHHMMDLYELVSEVYTPYDGPVRTQL